MPVDLLDGVTVEDEADGVLVVVPDALTEVVIRRQTLLTPPMATRLT
jgi:hypothetical protein